MKNELRCKIFGHKYKIIKRLSGGDYPEYHERCVRCGKDTIAKYIRIGKVHLVEREDKNE